jgi:hypothetical protein
MRPQATGRSNIPNEINPERIRTIADAARVPIGAEAPGRIARGLTPTITNFAALKLAMPLEVEPSTFTVVMRREVEQ